MSSHSIEAGLSTFSRCSLRDVCPSVCSKWNSKEAAPVGGLLHGYQAGVQVPPGLLVGVVTDVQTEPWVAQMATP